jgi:peptidoglycan/LPS O-acetylase OafA/YrhL
MAIDGSSLMRFFKTDFLSDHLGTRKNNFTLIRLLFAVFVLIAHAYALTNFTHHHVSDPLSHHLPKGVGGIGALAVDGFFFISGILITQSYIRREDLKAFALARLYRIYPAYIVCLLLCVFLLGPLRSTLSFLDYFRNPEVYAYLVQNSFLCKVRFDLPGLFQSNPLSAVNGSSWTLPVELRCYFVVGILGVLGLLRNARRTNLTLLVIALIAYWNFDVVPFVGEHRQFLRPSLYFALGIFCCLNAKSIPLNGWIMLGIWGLYILGFKSQWNEVTFGLTLCYGILISAYRLPALDLDRWGDFSYGIYIYAFPIQQLIVSLSPHGGPRQNILISLPSVFLLAVLSWNFVEKPALALVRKRDNRSLSDVVPPVTNENTSVQTTLAN